MSQPDHKGNGTNTNQTGDDKNNIPDDVDFDPSESAVFTWDEDDPQNPETLTPIAGEEDPPVQGVPVSRFGEISSFLNQEFQPESADPRVEEGSDSMDLHPMPNLIDIVPAQKAQPVPEPEVAAPVMDTSEQNAAAPADAPSSMAQADSHADALSIMPQEPISTAPEETELPSASDAVVAESPTESSPAPHAENPDQQLPGIAEAMDAEAASDGPPPEGQSFHLVEQRLEEEPFFPIPKHVPEIPPEDTEDITGQRERARGGIFSLIFNIMLIGGIVFIFASIAIALIYYKHASSRLYDAQETSDREFVLTVNPGDRFGTIIERLRSEHVIDSYMGVDDKFLMKYLAWANENSHLIKAGAYKLNANMSLSDVYARLIKGSQDFKITIPEGKTVAEIAAIVRSKNDFFDAEQFVQLTRDPSFIQRAGFQVPTLEGYLYPSTYFFGPGMKEEDLIKTMLQTFKETVGEKLKDVPHTDDLTFHQHIIMASLIEREARVDADRPLIASVMFNRIKKGMPLQIDASVLYAVGSWTKTLTYADLKIDHPYNTYRNKGLPPGPICNPRITSILATFQPAVTDFVYYVYKGDGSHAFAKTFDEHKANVRLYLKNRPDAVDTESTQAAVLAAAVPAATAAEAAGTTESEAIAPTPTPKPKPTKAAATKTPAKKASAKKTVAPTKRKSPTPKPTGTKKPTTRATPKSKATPKPTPKPTARPTPKPTPEKVARTSPLDHTSHAAIC